MQVRIKARVLAKYEESAKGQLIMFRTELLVLCYYTDVNNDRSVFCFRQIIVEYECMAGFSSVTAHNKF